MLPLPDLLQKDKALGHQLHEVHEALNFLLLGLLAAHVAGEDRYGHFDVAPPPAGRMLEAEFERCRRNIAVKQGIIYKGVRPDQVKQTPNSIGYVELIFARQNKMSFGKVKNAAGNFVEASLASVTAAATGAIKEMPDDFRVSITNAPGKDSYPVSSFTWLLIPSKIQDAGKKKAITDFLKWMMTDGQAMTAALDYAPLPKGVVTKELKAIAKVP